MTTKTYTVMKDGRSIGTFKTLAAAKKEAEGKRAQVVCGGKTVYEPHVDVAEPHADVEKPHASAAKPRTAVAEPHAEVSVESRTTQPKPYRIKSCMNVREAPGGRIVSMLAAGIIVSVTEQRDDWIHLTDGNWVLCGHGAFAEPVGDEQ